MLRNATVTNNPMYRLYLLSHYMDAYVAQVFARILRVGLRVRRADLTRSLPRQVVSSLCDICKTLDKTDLAVRPRVYDS